jgi:hypothetical protein
MVLSAYLYVVLQIRSRGAQGHPRSHAPLPARIGIGFVNARPLRH